MAERESEEGPARGRWEDLPPPRALISNDTLPDRTDAMALAELMAGVGSWSWDSTTREVHWSPGMHALLGSPPEGPTDIIKVIHPDDADRYRRSITATLSDDVPFDEEYRILWPDGTVRWVHGRAQAEKRPSGAIERVVGFVQDIHERKEAELRQAATEAELAHHREILEGIAVGAPVDETLESICRLVETDFPGTLCSFLLVDPDGERLHHVVAPSLPPEYVERLDGVAVAEGAGACGTAAARNEAVVVADTLADPTTEPFRDLALAHDLRSVWSHPVRLASGEVAGTFAVYRSHVHTPDDEEVRRVTALGHLAGLAVERHRNLAALTTAARVDPLTGLPNRTQFLQQLSDAIAQGDGSVAVLFIDLDHFKWVNDSQGHPMGDGVLEAVGQRFRTVLRDSDLLARFGGDEFTVLVRTDQPAQAELVAGRLRESLHRPFLLPDGTELFLSASIGIAFAEPGSEASEVIRNADTAMYRAKDAGRGRHAIYESVLRDRAVERISLETQLRYALDRGELVVHYQPVASLTEPRWVSVEALVRWDHPERGLLLPGEFIPLAEETGLVVPLGSVVLEQAMAQAAIWARRGFGLPVAVNASIRQLTDRDFPHLIARTLSAHGVEPRRLLIEVTETSVMEHLDACRDVLSALAEMGVRIGIDDFGTGHSSIARLRDLPVSAAKVDRAFTTDLEDDPRAVVLLEAITTLAHSLDLKVVAEGIETAGAAALARGAGCDFAQGFHTARPVPPAEAEQLLSSPVPPPAPIVTP